MMTTVKDNSLETAIVRTRRRSIDWQSRSVPAFVAAALGIGHVCAWVFQYEPELDTAEANLAVNTFHEFTEERT